MKIYYGGCERPNAIHTLAGAGGRRVMISFAEPPTETCWQLYREYGIEVMADSGAFSAWKRGTPINLQDYMDWLKKHDIKLYFNLDVVVNPIETVINQFNMEAAGFKPIPVFHYGENWGLLEYYVLNYELVGLGGTVGLPVREKERFFSQVFSLYPEGKFHALGVAKDRYLSKYPFDSADSVWWVYKFRDKQKRYASGDNRKDEQTARVKHLKRLSELKEKQYQGALPL